LGTFGEKLRKQREQRGLALDAISNTTKISTRMLRALEEEHFDQLPGGVFNKGFVRAYARQVGLDEEEAVTDYLAALRESQVQSQKILPDFRNPGSKTPAVTFSDSPHQIISSSAHPSGDGKDKSHEVSTAERRRNEDRRNEERRNEVRRNQDRLPQDDDGEPPHQLPVVAAIRNNARPNDGKRDHDHREPEQNSNRVGEVRELTKRHQDRSETRAQDTTSMPGFITLGAASEDSTEGPDAPSPRLSLPTKLAAAVLLLIVGLAAWLIHRHQESSPHSAVSSNPSSSLSAAESPAPTVTSAAAPPTAPPTKIAAVPSDRKPFVAKSSPPSSEVGKSPTASSPKPAASSSSADTPVVASTTSALTTKPAATFSLTIRADQTTWISITADGKPVAHETLIAPAHTSVRAAHEIAVRVGNAAGVSFVLNGKEFPAEGNAGEVKTYVFDDTGLKPVGTPSATTN
jgi:cytoskeletal protein RodZ